MNFFNTFRGRLLLILSFLLIATLGVQFYVNLVRQQENDNLRRMQEQALVAGITLGFTTIPLKDTPRVAIRRKDRINKSLPRNVLKKFIRLLPGREITDSY